MQKASFQTRARAIDHLGRGQIADAPTAISELWKNAYDAYARDVELHIFQSSVDAACIIDNGCGMTTEDLLNKWLVIGTDSKIGTNLLPEDTCGLPPRVRQGEKGIGRLSAGFLGPVTLVVSKKRDSSFSVLLVDWRFFENPYLFIDDISFPLMEVENLRDIPKVLKHMGQELHDSITHAPERVYDAWLRFDDLESKTGLKETTSERILDFDASTALPLMPLARWNDVLKKLPEEEGKHGTALFCFEVCTELSNWLEGDLGTPEQHDVRTNLRETLISFVDPLSEVELNFEYGVYVHAPQKPVFPVLQSEDGFTLDDFLLCEHWVKGEFDKRGVFKGKVKAFNLEPQDVVIAPREYIPEKQSRNKLGPFQLMLATFEQVASRSSHSPEQFAQLERLKQYAGISIYRDSLRVLPYGRDGADLFNVEARRTLNAGHYMFSYRRTFGGVSFSSLENPNLKDKAGREGLVDNKPRRAMERLVKNVMVELAETYYGRKSPLRLPMLEKARKRYEKEQKEAEKLKKRTKKNFIAFLKVSTPKTHEGLQAAREHSETLDVAMKSSDKEALFQIRESVQALADLRDGLKLPIKPYDDDVYEEDYRIYRDTYISFCQELEKLKEKISELELQGVFGTPKEVVTTYFASNQSKLSSQLTKYRNLITAKSDSIANHWASLAREDTKKYSALHADYLTQTYEVQDLQSALNELDKRYVELYEEFSSRYAPVISALESIDENIDIDGAWAHTERENVTLQNKVHMLHEAAQLGITVEIIGHELSAMESQVAMGMRSFPHEIKRLKAYNNTLEAQKALTDRLRFLSPLKKVAYRSREAITGKAIGTYITKFFGNAFEAVRAEFEVTDMFKAFTIQDLQSRIFPCFINLVHNALYWVRFTKENEPRRIILDRKENLVIIADTGSGIDNEDTEKIFELFYTRRTEGRGIGLYLCRQNLAVVGHTIRCATADDPKILDGANFIIELKGAKYDS